MAQPKLLDPVRRQFLVRYVFLLVFGLDDFVPQALAPPNLAGNVFAVLAVTAAYKKEAGGRMSTLTSGTKLVTTPHGYLAVFNRAFICGYGQVFCHKTFEAVSLTFRTAV